ncbi:hypothetical protein EN939_20280, partial [Mesorhizobium sp. M7A.F.Ca.CA.002.05.1.1]
MACAEIHSFSLKPRLRRIVPFWLNTYGFAGGGFDGGGHPGRLTRLAIRPIAPPETVLRTLMTSDTNLHDAPAVGPDTDWQADVRAGV